MKKFFIAFIFLGLCLFITSFIFGKLSAIGREVAIKTEKEYQEKSKNKDSKDTQKKENKDKKIYYCPMHPNYTSDKPGKCPICGMNLVPNEREKIQEDDKNKDINKNEEKEGEKFFFTFCFSCHDISRPKNAPPILAVSAKYRIFFNDKESFVNAIKDLRDPNPAKMKMCGCVVRRFGNMPPLNLPDDILDKIANFMWEIPSDMKDMKGMGMCGPKMRDMGSC